MKLKDITIDQAIEIAKLAYGHNDWIQSNFEVSYIPQENSDVLNGIYEDSPEMLQIFFRGISFGNKIDRYRLIIYSNLNLSFNIIRKKSDKPIELITVGIYNQYNIFKKFEEWNVEPKRHKEYEIHKENEY